MNENETDTRKRTRAFIQLVLQDKSGHIALARKSNGMLINRFYEWPNEADRVIDWVEKSRSGNDLYFVPHLLRQPKRIKSNVIECPALWADLDTCPPDKLLVPPTVTVASSEGKWQALWLLEHPMHPVEAEELCRRIAYKHQPSGADTGTWNLGRLLRIPFTYNYKYTPSQFIDATVKELVYKPEDFSCYGEIEEQSIGAVPNLDGINLDALVARIPLELRDVYETAPIGDWSSALWLLERGLLESGLTKEETFAIVRTSACNKYKRDGRKEVELWREIYKAEVKTSRPIVVEAPKPNGLPRLLTDEQRKQATTQDDFIRQYINWGTSVTDATEQYHEAGAFFLLSSALADVIRLPTAFGMFIPNLWFMLLADTTITRKSTAMDMANDLIKEVDDEYQVANDGSVEGIFRALSNRAGRTSVFVRDELSGLIESMGKRDYMSGMSEAFARLYDGRDYQRVLSKETITVKSPIFLVFAGGAKTKTMEAMTTELISSGFAPRFIFISGEADPDRIKPMGPPSDKTDSERASIESNLRKIYEFYHRDITIRIGSSDPVTQRKIFKAKLTPEAWNLYRQAEDALVRYALNHDISKVLLTPTFDRLAKSGLKASVLISAARELQEEIVVTEQDMITALYYVERWAPHSIEVISRVGEGPGERIIKNVYYAVVAAGQVKQSRIMYHQSLSAKTAKEVFSTLEQRGMLRRVQGGADPMWEDNG